MLTTDESLDFAHPQINLFYKDFYLFISNMVSHYDPSFSLTTQRKRKKNQRMAHVSDFIWLYLIIWYIANKTHQLNSLHMIQNFFFIFVPNIYVFKKLN